jgi:DNA-directed RNA polymerase specialized sigma24 family protein
VPQLSPKRRAVVELDRDDVPVEEIQARLAVSRDVVYASRSRALKDLAKLREQYEG